MGERGGIALIKKYLNLKNLKKKADCLADCLFPRRCPVCEKIVVPAKELICPSCFRELSFVKNPTCKCCGKELWSDRLEYCLDCEKHPHSFESGMALVNYDDISRRSMAAIKYKNKREYLDFYSEAIWKRYGKRLKRLEADLIIPVPLHPARYRERGFNQAEELAKRLGRRMGVPVGRAGLVRIKKTKPQKNLTSAQRRENLMKAFQCKERPPAGKTTALLVDDIYTTGSTLEACAKVLKKAGWKRVYFVSICIGRN